MTEAAKGEMNCPTHDHLMAFVERRLTPEQMTVVAGHLVICAKCRDYVGYYSEWAKTDVTIAAESEKDRLRQALASTRRRMEAWRAFFRQFQNAEIAAAADGYDVQHEVAQRAGHTVFRSRVQEGKEAWTVVVPNLTGPVSADLELCFQVYDGEDRPVPVGELTISGVKLPVENGRALLKGAVLKDLIEISLRREGGVESPGDIDPDVVE